MSGDLKADSILAAEYEYIAQAAFETNEDRAKVSTFFVLTVGGFLAAILGLRTATLPTQSTYFAFAIIFALLSLYAGIMLLQLVRLRQAAHHTNLG